MYGFGQVTPAITMDAAGIYRWTPEMVAAFEGLAVHAGAKISGFGKRFMIVDIVPLDQSDTTLPQMMQTFKDQGWLIVSEDLEALLQSGPGEPQRPHTIVGIAPDAFAAVEGTGWDPTGENAVKELDAEPPVASLSALSEEAPVVYMPAWLDAEIAKKLGITTPSGEHAEAGAGLNTVAMVIGVVAIGGVLYLMLKK